MPKCIITVPAYVKVWHKKKFHKCYLNMNNYRNWHGVFCDLVKKEFYKKTKDTIKELPKMVYIESLKYTLIVPTKRSRDRMNVYSVVDKFFCDALQEFDIIEDDKDEMIGAFLFTQKEYERGENEDVRVRISIIFDKK